MSLLLGRVSTHTLICLGSVSVPVQETDAQATLEYRVSLISGMCVESFAQILTHSKCRRETLSTLQKVAGLLSSRRIEERALRHNVVDLQQNRVDTSEDLPDPDGPQKTTTSCNGILSRGICKLF